MDTLQRRPWKFAGSTYRRSTEICTVCLNLNLEKQGEENRKVRIRYFELAESAELEDCIYCALIFRALENAEAEISHDTYDLVSVHAEKERAFFISWDDVRLGIRYMEIYQDSGVPCQVKYLGSASEISIDPSDDFIITKALNWILTCDETHPECIRHPRSIPKRLLDVGHSQDSTVRVIENYKPQKYVALSHCWGKGRKCITTTDNLAVRKEGIPWDEMPKTFQDAITVIRQLGIQYLWADSLCIVQDDELDWQTESVKMGEIYEDAYVTIAAALSADDEDGFLRPTPERAGFQSWNLPLSFQGEVVKGVRIRRVHDVRHHEVTEPLSSRGWTLQERLLSSRLLTYTSAVTFECARTSNCECGHTIYANPLYPGVEKQWMLERRNFRALLESPDNNRERVLSYWMSHILPHYTSRHLTKDSDRLPAIHPLAMKLQEKLGDPYIFGLWRGAIVKGLGWVRSVAASHDGLSSEETRLPRTYRAPSWSWASIEGPLKQWEAQTEVCSVVDVDDTGARGGYLILKGPALEVSVKVELPFHSDSRRWIRRLNAPTDEYIEVTFNTLRFDAPVEVSPAQGNDGVEYLSLLRCHEFPGWPDDSLTATVLCLKLRGSLAQNEAEFLVLGGLSDPPGSYQRIGLLYVGPFVDPNDADELGHYKKHLPIREVTIY